MGEHNQIEVAYRWSVDRELDWVEYCSIMKQGHRFKSYTGQFLASHWLYAKYSWSPEGRGQAGQELCLNILHHWKTTQKACLVWEGTDSFIVMFNSHAFLRKASKKESKF